jgi:hypothetical protein
MSGTIPPLWHGVQLERRDNFTLPYLIDLRATYRRFSFTSTGHDIPVSEETSYGLDDRGFDFRKGRDLLDTACKLTLGLTQLPIMWVSLAVPPEIKWLEYNKDHSAPSSSDV